MKSLSYSSIIPKIIIVLGTLSVLGIILLFLRPRPELPKKITVPALPEKLFTQVIEASIPGVLELWERGDRFIPKAGLKCDQEVIHSKKVGNAYYQCNPNFWQCFWAGGVKENPSLVVEFSGQTYNVEAIPHFDSRFYGLFHRKFQGPEIKYGYLVELSVAEIPSLSQTVLLTDTCRDTYLPERIYGYGKAQNKLDEGFIWDNFGRGIFIDKFYVSNRQVNEWKILNGKLDQIEKDRSKWPSPAFLNRKDQKEYCKFYGKKLLDAKLFDAATMTPSDLKNPFPSRIYRPETPWQRDLSRTFLGTARLNPDYQLTPLDCELAEVQGCQEKFYSLDSATWMGFHYGIGFNAESFENTIEPKKILKKSSKYFPPASPWHELANRTDWDGELDSQNPVAFRCYEEVSL